MRIHRLVTQLSLSAFLGGASLSAQMPTSIAAPPRQQDTKSVAKPTPQAAAKPDSALLPSLFSGWQADAAATAIHDAAQADSANAAALKEYGFSDALFSNYSRDGETLKIKAFRFGDATGAYGAYSFYRQSGWPKEQIGAGAASDHGHVLFWVGNILVDSQFSHISTMSGSELRELAASIPQPAGNKSVAPPILANLPQKNLSGQSAHYALGPAGYSGPSEATSPEGVLPVGLVGFDHGAETVTANYKLQSGPATLTLIDYPTPEMAAAQAKIISEYLKAGNSPQHPFTKPLLDSNPTVLEVRRSGPLVAVISGDPIQEEAHKLIESVHYEADVSSIPGEPSHDVQNFAKLILGIIVLVVVMFVAAIIVAVFLGGGRAAFRVMRGKPASSLLDEDFIRLDLRD